jgi:hypothetical protein
MPPVLLILNHRSIFLAVRLRVVPLRWDVVDAPGIQIRFKPTYALPLASFLRHFHRTDCLDPYLPRLYDHDTLRLHLPRVEAPLWRCPWSHACANSPIARIFCSLISAPSALLLLNRVRSRQPYRKQMLMDLILRYILLIMPLYVVPK